MKVIELFAGIGAWSKALENLNITHKVVAAIEFDKKTMDCYNSIHGTTFVAQDITKVNPKDLPDCDMICYSPPCQSFSAAGKGLGTTDPRGTLFWDALRIIQEKKPKFCLMENVKNLTGKAHRETFDSMLEALEDAGYTNYWQVLNAKDYGIPQNRERVFVVSIRKDIKQIFEFPQSFDNGLRLKDLLEESVDEKYYVSDEKCQKLLEQFNRPRNDGITNTLTTIQKDNYLCIPVLTPERLEKRQNGRRFKTNDEPAFTVTAIDRHGVLLNKPEIIQIGRIELNGNDICKRVYSQNGVSLTLPTGQSGNTIPKVIIEDFYSNRDARVYENYSPALRSERIGLKTVSNYRIRKLTPLECIRLMGFSDEDYEKLKESNISNSQIYKVCGNSIVVNVVESIFKQLL